MREQENIPGKKICPPTVNHSVPIDGVIDRNGDRSPLSDSSWCPVHWSRWGHARTF